MPLSDSSLSTKIQTELVAVFGAPADAAMLKNFSDAVAKAIVAEITSNALVNVQSHPPGGTAVGTIT